MFYYDHDKKRLKDVNKKFVYTYEKNGTFSSKKFTEITSNEEQAKIDRHYYVMISNIDFYRCLNSQEFEVEKMKSYAEEFQKNRKKLKEEQEKTGNIKIYLKEIEKLKKLNANLLRICKERANQDRKLPKKFNGFLVMYSRQVKKLVKSKFRNNLEEQTFWETLIQTPLKSSFDYESVKTAVEEKYQEVKNFISDYKNNKKVGFWEVKFISKNYIDF